MLRPLPDTTWAAAAATVSWPALRAPVGSLAAGLDADEPNARRAGPNSACVDTFDGDPGTAIRLSAPPDDAAREPADRDPDLPDLAGPACTLAAGPAAGPEAELDSDSAPEPVVSADATDCIDAIAVPTPTATATAPTRAHPSADQCFRLDPAMFGEPVMRSESGDALIRPPLLELCPVRSPVAHREACLPGVHENDHVCPPRR